MPQHSLEIVATVLFAVAVLHTFFTKPFERLAHKQPAHSGIWHFFGEVEAVFGIWAAALIAVIAASAGPATAVTYLESLNFTEPMFVFVVMVVAATRPIIDLCGRLVLRLARLLPGSSSVSCYFLLLSVVPLLGSLMTEPAAMTLAALMLSRTFFSRELSAHLKYATVGVLFVNVSIGGTLTHFAAPPVLMVSQTWGWDTPFMLTTFGWKAALAVFVNAAIVTFLFRRELRRLPAPVSSEARRAPLVVVLVHLLCLAGVVVAGHHPVVFMGIFLLFLGFADAYARYQDRLILREGLMVALFLAGLVVLGGLQRWWLQPTLEGMENLTLFFGAAALTALTDNAALTYLGSLVQGVDAQFQYALVAGAVTGGGLTVIANAPNPAGMAILKRHFPDEAVHPLGLLGAALGPTMVAAAAFLML